MEITTSLHPVPQPEEVPKVVHVLRPAIRTITQSSACRRRALLPTYGLCFGKHAAQRFCLPVESVSEGSSAADNRILQVVDSVWKIFGSLKVIGEKLDGLFRKVCCQSGDSCKSRHVASAESRGRTRRSWMSLQESINIGKPSVTE